MQFDLAMTAKRQKWARKLTAEHGAKYIVMGGSSTAFGIDSDYLLREEKIVMANFGMTAGLGPKVIAQTALAEARPGDTVLLAFEPGLLVGSSAPVAYSVQMAFRVGHPEWVTEDSLGVPGFSWPAAVLALRPGAYRFLAQVGKNVLGMPAFRYRVEDSPGESGFLTTAVRAPIGDTPRRPLLSDEGAALLTGIRDWCAARQIRCFYVLPWGYCRPEAAEAFRQENRYFVAQVSAFVPVLQDPMLGAYAVPEHFADTNWHLTTEGARVRTRALARHLRAGDVWPAVTPAPPPVPLR